MGKNVMQRFLITWYIKLGVVGYTAASHHRHYLTLINFNVLERSLISSSIRNLECMHLHVLLLITLNLANSYSLLGLKPNPIQTEWYSMRCKIFKK